MSLNWKEIDLVIDELNLPGSFIQQIIQPDFRNVFLQIYRPGARFWLRVCLETGATRIHRSSFAPSKPKTRQRFAQLLHSRIKGAKIQSVEHVNHDRIVRLDLTRGGRQTVLWIRLWGGASNLIVCEPDGTIVDAFFRRPKRGEISGGAYSPPHSDRPAGEYEARFAPGPSDTTTVSTGIEEYYGEVAGEAQRKTLVDAAQRALSKRRTRVRDQLARSRSRLTESVGADRLTNYGNIIMANLHRLHTGDEWLEADDFTADNTSISIELEPSLSPQANAERYFDKAKKARQRKNALKSEVSRLEQEQGSLEKSASRVPELDEDELRELLVDLEPQPQTNRTQTRQVPGLRFTSGSFEILVGRNSRENDSLLRHHVRGNDLWLHTRDHPGGYVFVRAVKNKSVPLDVLLDAGNLAVHFSKARPDGRAELYYTQVKYLRRAKGGPVGLVLPTNEKNLTITTDEERLSRLRGQNDG